jgi:formyltetrahydrofolate-dependent phosphoribosylglycinamide formyltransferase
VAAAAAAGQRVFGESRVQDARDKIPACPPGLEWHFIGHLQKNKVRQALPLFSLFHSIDSTPLAQAIDRFDHPGQPALVVLAGFMRILTPAFVARYAGRLLNIHPSLLPAFPGLHTHQKALQAGCRFAGATVHQVTADLDQGPILAQALVPILPGDDPQQLAARVLTQEHLIYPRAIAAWLENQGAEA